MAKNNPTLDLQYKEKVSGPVTCLGMEFENDEARRAYFNKQLSEKLKDPEFRKIEGFPIATDNAILELSDPPYYTACPNPFLNGLIDFIGKPYSDDIKYTREPYSEDIQGSKYVPMYKLHSYHTKVPYPIIMQYIQHYTDVGDIVFDGFGGSGMTGLALKMLHNPPMELKKEIQKLHPSYKWGERHGIVCELSPAASFIASNYVNASDMGHINNVIDQAYELLEKQTSYLYEYTINNQQININYIVWSEVIVCENCENTVSIWEGSVEYEIGNKVGISHDKVTCPKCSVEMSKRGLKKVFHTTWDSIAQEMTNTVKLVPVLLNFRDSDNNVKEIELNEEESSRLSKEFSEYVDENVFPRTIIPYTHQTHERNNLMKSHGYTYLHQFFQPHTLKIFHEWRKIADLFPEHKNLLLWLMTATFNRLTKLVRYMPQHKERNVGPLSGTFYMPKLFGEINPLTVLKRKIASFNQSSFEHNSDSKVFISTQSSTTLTNIMDNTIDYIFTDPPFGGNIMYSDLNMLWESWLEVMTKSDSEAIINTAQKKDLAQYQTLMSQCFAENYRILKPGRWMTIEFSNTSAGVWNSIQTALSDAGFIVANVSALDKQRGGLQAIIGKTAVKQDLVISAYKPNKKFEVNFSADNGSKESVWDFIREHLKHITIYKKSNESMSYVPERDPRILFDQVVAYYVRKGYLVPISSSEFQVGLAQRFSERDGMYFLPEQVSEYDKKKMSVKELMQMSLFVSDESSAIAWLRQQLKQKSQTFQDLNPQFMQETSGWSKNEKMLELSTLLEENFLMYDGKGKVPEQIHAYLSTNWKDMRNLDKEDPVLMEKAKSRWYVPDPNKAGDLEKVREKSLLKEFEAYKAEKKKLKLFRIEAVRAGFKKAWQERDYKTIIAIAEKIPTNVLEEDPKLLMWFDQSVTRVEG